MCTARLLTTNRHRQTPGFPLEPRMLEDVRMRSVGLFAGIGGFEVGLQRAGIGTELLCEYREPAATVLAKRFDTDVVGDIRDLEALPSVDIVTAGVPALT